MTGILLDGLTAAVSLLVALALYPLAIRLLRRAKAGQVIQAELPAAHQTKAGTPTGGGCSASRAPTPSTALRTLA